MLWGCRKFSKKLINPDHVPSSELLNFLSRVPDDVTVRKCKQLNVKDPVLVAKEDERRTSRDECKSWSNLYIRHKTRHFATSNPIPAIPLRNLYGAGILM